MRSIRLSLVIVAVLFASICLSACRIRVMMWSGTVKKKDDEWIEYRQGVLTFNFVQLLHQLAILLLFGRFRDHWVSQLLLFLINQEFLLRRHGVLQLLVVLDFQMIPNFVKDCWLVLLPRTMEQILHFTRIVAPDGSPSTHHIQMLSRV